MECGIPIVDGRVIPAKRDLQMIVLFKPDNAPLDFHVESRCRRGSQSRVGARRETQFTEETHSGRQSRTEMKDKLPFVESAMTSFQSRREKIDVAKATKMQRGIG